MQNPKVAIDTNVIVAASIIANVREQNIPIKHQYYDQSRRLFSVFRKRQQDKLGIIVPRVKSEAFLVLSRAVKDVFIGNNKMNISLRRIFFEKAVAIINSCDYKMRALLASVIHVRLPEHEVQRNLKKVDSMAKYIKHTLYPQYNQKYKRLQQTKDRAKPTDTAPNWKDEQKDEAFYAHYSQVELEFKQIERFMRKYPNAPDQRVLAEVITAKDNFCKQQNYSFLLASCDSGFFSPYVWRGAESDLVTKEIQTRFNIVCHYPDRIYTLIGGHHTENPN
ncbi:hypothetical protein [Candidatus Nitrosotenuis aquarius]|uniref:hypothetical protein n=1 Tax=Candidatus Nitrosotenuis aquarius TaxID=1846278 RepID=UPI000C1EC95F|nr:hypothetical protein [Candidatus Nitrosotenuis aquarius]